MVLPFLSLVSIAFASSFYEVPFPDTVRDTPTIVRGRIGKSETQWVTLPDSSKRLFTFYDIEVSESFKGQAKGLIRIRELGGEKDGVSLQISGSAQFSPGEDVVVMLGSPLRGSENTYPLSGMMMGKYTLEKGADGKEYLRGSGLGSSIHPKLRKENMGAKDLQISLDGLREMIRTQAAEPSRPSPEKAAAQKKVPSEEPLLSSKARITDSTENSLPRDISEKPQDRPLPLRFIYLVIGIAIGAYWFLKRKKNRR